MKKSEIIFLIVVVILIAFVFIAPNLGTKPKDEESNTFKKGVYKLRTNMTDYLETITFYDNKTFTKSYKWGSNNLTTTGTYEVDYDKVILTNKYYSNNYEGGEKTAGEYEGECPEIYEIIDSSISNIASYCEIEEGKDTRTGEKVFDLMK